MKKEQPKQVKNQPQPKAATKPMDSSKTTMSSQKTPAQTPTGTKR